MKSVMLRWDVAIDKNKVKYIAYYQNKPFDFIKDPKLTGATKKVLMPSIGSGYENGSSANTYPYQCEIDGLIPGDTYYFVIRAMDNSLNENEDSNNVFLTGIPLS